ncbi:MAG TPA: OmpA family protein [Paludibacter sp.]|nr:OmpA family protein [Paludibacter sp.]
MNIHTYIRMKLPARKWVVLLLLFSGLVMDAGAVEAPKPSPKMDRSKMAFILRQANAEYDKSRFAYAAADYEKYLGQDAAGKAIQPVQVLKKLADCYWQLKDAAGAFRVYSLLYPDANKKGDATEELQVRIGELYARFGMYKQAALWLQGVPAYEAKALLYSKKVKLELLKRDSLSWKIGFLNINSPYRDYSPVLMGNTLFFSSNRPLPVQEAVSKWDDDCYTRLRKVALAKVHGDSVNAAGNSLELQKGKTGIVSTKPIAPLYEGADVESVENEMQYMFDKRYKRGGDALTSVVEGLSKIDFNTAGISFDGNSHVYFSANYPKNKNKVNQICLMEGVYSSKGISGAKVLPFGNVKSYSVMLPAISPDGKTLVFCSDKPGGKGKMDLYYAQRDTVKHSWGAMKTFGGDINTSGNEVFPSITPDGYLYFSADSRPGLGGLDIFRVLLDDAIRGKGVPVPLSYPVNSPADDFGWTVDEGGTRGFFTSDRLNSGDDLYSFNYEPYNKVRVITGYALEEQTKKPVPDATIFMLNYSTNEVNIARTDINGKYLLPVKSADKVIVKAMKSGMSNDFLVDTPHGITQLADTITKTVQDFLLDIQPDSENDWAETKSDSAAFVGSADGEQLNDSTLKVIQNRMMAKQNFKINNSWKLNNIYYDYNKADIRNEVKPMLDSLITMLEKLPLRVEISSHTDSRGSDEYNDKLSQQRADSVVAYLIEHGIASSRVVAKGFGKRRLIVDCGDAVPCSESDHQMNRRTEVKVMGYSHKEKTYKFDPGKYKAGQIIDKATLPKDFFDN